MRVISLTYHDIVEGGGYSSSGFQSPDADIYKLDRAEFEQQLALIQQVATVSLLGHFPPPSTPFTVLLTFDDGGAGAERTAGILEQSGCRGHFFITTDFIGKPGFLNGAAIRDLRRRGHIIGSHSCSHPPRMSKCSRQQMHREWSESVHVLADTLGESIQCASVPGGYYSRQVALEAARCGIETLFNSEPVSRPSQVERCRVFGRYSVQQGVAASTVQALAAGDPGPRMRQYLLWNLKKAAKALGGRYWLQLRKAILARRRDL